MKLTDDQLERAEQLARRLGSQNCWTGCSGSLASYALWMIQEQREARRMERAQLIGITGRAGSGKNTVASMVAGAVVIQFADPLYAMVAAMTGVPESLLRDRAAKERALPGLGKSPRQLLQTLGTEWGRDLVDREIWVKLTAKRVEQLEIAGWQRVVICDVRFDNEARWIREAGGEVWQVVRSTPGVAPHASELGVSADLVDRRIYNAGGLDELRHEVALAGLAEAL